VAFFFFLFQPFQDSKVTKLGTKFYKILILGFATPEQQSEQWHPSLHNPDPQLMYQRLPLWVHQPVHVIQLALDRRPQSNGLNVGSQGHDGWRNPHVRCQISGTCRGYLVNIKCHGE